MDNARKGEIALLVLQHKLRKEGVRLGPNFRREIGSAAKIMGIPMAEAMEFAGALVREYVEETFSKSEEPTDNNAEGDK